MANPTTRFVVDDTNAFRHHSNEPNIPYVNEDVETMFHFTGAKNVRCFNGRVVDGVVRYGVSYAVVDFDVVEDAIAVFRTFQAERTIRRVSTSGRNLRIVRIGYLVGSCPEPWTQRRGAKRRRSG